MGFIDGLIQGMGQAQLRKIQLDAMKSQKEAQKVEFELKKQKAEEDKYWREYFTGATPQPGVPQFENTGGTNPWTRGQGGQDLVERLATDPKFFIAAMKAGIPADKLLASRQIGMATAVGPNGEPINTPYNRYTGERVGEGFAKGLPEYEGIPVTLPDGSKGIQYRLKRDLATTAGATTPGAPSPSRVKESDLTFPFSDEKSNEIDTKNLVRTQPPESEMKPGTVNETTRTKLGDLDNTLALLSDLMAKTKPEYLGASGTVKGLTNKATYINSIAPDWMKIEGDPGYDAFTLLYNRIKNADRNVLFGASLTDAEKASFEMAFAALGRGDYKLFQSQMSALIQSVQSKRESTYNAATASPAQLSQSTVTPSRIPPNMMPVQDRIKQLELEKDALNADVESAFKSGDQEAAARLNEQLYAVLDQLSELRQKGNAQPVKPSLGVKHPKVIGRQGDTWKIGF